VQRYYND